MSWYAAHVYRTIARVAKTRPRDHALAPADGRLQVMEAGKRIAWYRLNTEGEPTPTARTRMKRPDSAGRGNTRRTAFGIRCGHRMRTERFARRSIRYEVNAVLGDAAFARPKL